MKRPPAVAVDPLGESRDRVYLPSSEDSDNATEGGGGGRMEGGGRMDGGVRTARFRNVCSLLSQALEELEHCEKDEIERTVLALHFTPLERLVQDRLYLGFSEMRPSGLLARSPSEVSTQSLPPTLSASFFQHTGTSVGARRPSQCICGKLLADDFISYYNEGLLGELSLDRLQGYFKVHGLPLPHDHYDAQRRLLDHMRLEREEEERQQAAKTPQISEDSGSVRSYSSLPLETGVEVGVKKETRVNRNIAAASVATRRTPPSQTLMQRRGSLKKEKDVASNKPPTTVTTPPSQPRLSRHGSAGSRGSGGGGRVAVSGVVVSSALRKASNVALHSPKSKDATGSVRAKTAVCRLNPTVKK